MKSFISGKNFISGPITLSRAGLYGVLLTVGTLTCTSFFLGFYSGKHTGFEMAIDSTRASLPKVPVILPKSVPVSETEKIVKDIYAKLATESKSQKSENSFNMKKEDVSIVAPISEAIIQPQNFNDRVFWGEPKKGFYVLVASPRKREDADSLSRSLVRSGFEVIVQTQTVKDVTYFRVLVGPESKESQGNMLLEELKRESYITGEPILVSK